MGLLSSLAIFNRRKFIQNVQYVMFLVLIGFYIHVAFIVSNFMYQNDGPGLYEVIGQYGAIKTVLLYMSLCGTAYVSAPIAMLNLLGTIISNPFSNQTNEGLITIETPFICFRVVTRGMFPKLVAEVTQKNLETCRKVGLRHFKFEIVTDKTLNLNPSIDVREIVVPSNYRTPKCTLFKARALHYCLEQNVNILSSNDWITHLDEETLLTESVLHGIIEFITKPESNVGQGVITYGGCGIENWITTLLDGFRVSIDYGLYRFGLGYLHIPVFGFKGSFVVVQMHIEKRIGFDFGPKESIAEDLRFALSAWHNGYRFDFVKGIMKEKSTFSLADYIKQRKRWFIGHFHVIWSSSLPPYCKVVVFIFNICNMVQCFNIVGILCNLIYSVPFMDWQINVICLLVAHGMFMVMFGNFMSISHSRYALCSRLAICFMSQVLLYVMLCLDAFAYLQGTLQRNKICFDIVQKETAVREPKPLKNQNEHLESIV